MKKFYSLPNNVQELIVQCAIDAGLSTNSVAHRLGLDRKAVVKRREGCDVVPLSQKENDAIDFVVGSVVNGIRIGVLPTGEPVTVLPTAEVLDKMYDRFFE